MKTTRKQFLQTIAKGALVTAVPSYIRHNAPLQLRDERPNILWIIFEDTSPQFVGCYGNRGARTPNMDLLASQGVRFTSAFSTAPVCAPSRSALITGCLSEVLGTGHHRSYYQIPDFIKGFPYYLRRAGYYTTNNLKTDYNIGNKKFVQECWDERFGEGAWGTAFTSSLQNNQLDTWSENSKEAGWWHREAGQPFFSVFNLFSSHQSRTMTNPYAWYEEHVLERLSPAERISPDEVTMPPFYRDTPKMRRCLSRVYNSLKLTDNEVGGILARLERDGLKENTIVFCFADNGEGIPGGKMSVLGLGFQVPCFVYFPPKFQHLSPWPAGSTTEELVSVSEDFAPTMLSMAGIDIPEYMTGRPMVGAQRKKNRPFVWGGRNRIEETPDVSRCITNGRYFYTRVFMPQLPLVEYAKYAEVGEITRTIRADFATGSLDGIQSGWIGPGRPVEYLFDLRDDQWQINNLADHPAYKMQLQTMREELYRHLHETKDVLFMPEYEMARRAERMTPYEMREDEKEYPFERILDTANLVGYHSSLTLQLALLKDQNAIVRYWAAVGLYAQGDRARAYKKELIPAMKDDHPSVQIVIAGIVYKLYRLQKAKEILEQFLINENEHLILHALQVIEHMWNNAKPFVPSLHELSKRFSGRKGGLAYAIACMIDVMLHFLNGEPLYYEEFRGWTPEVYMQLDFHAHF